MNTPKNVRGVSVKSLTLLVATAMLAASNAQAAMVFTDNFNDGTIDPSAWTAYYDGTGPTLREVNGQVEIVLPANSAQTGAGYFTAGLTSTFLLGGDFDVQIDYSLLTWPADNGARVGFGIAPWYGANRASVSLSLEAYAFSSGGPTYFVPTDDLGGALRLARTGNVLTGYFLDGSGDWITIGTGIVPLEDYYLSFGSWSSDAEFGNMEVRSALDDFTATADYLVNAPTAVPEPSTIIAGLLLVGVLGTTELRRLLQQARL